MTLLMLASERNNASMVKWLLQRNADVNRKNEMRPVRQVACCVFPTDIVIVCVRSFAKRCVQQFTCCALCLCLLLCSQGGASTALMIAAQQGNCEMIQLLLEHGADINAVNKVITVE